LNWGLPTILAMAIRQITSEPILRYKLIPGMITNPKQGK
jgi:hypothetical protein